MFPEATSHGPMLDVCEGVRLVRGTFRMGPGMVISRTMTIVDVEGGVCVINTVRLDAAGEAALVKRGPVLHVIKLADGHGLDDPYYLKDGAVFWSTENAKHEKIPRGKTLAPETPIPGAKAFVLPGTSEAVVWLPNGGGTLVTCDSVQNHADTEGASLFARWFTPLLGFKGGVLVAAPMWRRVKKLDLAAVKGAFAPLTELSFENLVTGHGPAIAGGADVRLREAISRLT